jgi:hypothetical protein
MIDFLKILNEINWLLSLLIAIPLSILGNILTPTVQNWIGGHSKNAAKKRIEILENEISQHTLFFNNRSIFNSHLIMQLIVLIVFLAIPNVLMGVLASFMFTPLPESLFPIMQFMPALIMIITSLFNVMAVVRAIQSIKLFNRVENFSKYELETMALINKLKFKEG